MKNSIELRVISLFIIVLLQTDNLYSQSPVWQWAKSAPGNGIEYMNGIATDPGGRILVTGGYEGAPLTFGTTVLNNVGSGDIFVAKYDDLGNVIWANSAGGAGLEYGMSITTDAAGNVLVTGFFMSPTITFGTNVLTNTGDYDIFVVKYDGSGNVLWARSASGANLDIGNAISTDDLGNVLITGYFSSPTLTFGTTVLTNTGSDDIFVVKYDASGNLLWAKSVGGNASDGGYGISTDAAGNILVSGGFESPSITFGTTVFTNSGGADIFTAKYDASGTLLWAKSTGGSSEEWILSNCTDPVGNVLVTGYFLSPTITFGTNVFTNTGDYDMFIVKYDTAGNVIWANASVGSALDYGNSITTDAAGNALITGAFTSDTLFLGATYLTNAGYYDIFVAKYDTSGNFLWAKSEGGTDLDYGVSIATDPAGNAVISGGFGSDSITFGTSVIANTGIWDLFIAKLDIETGMEEVNHPFNSITIAPNPFTDELIITYSNPKENTEIKIWNIYGSVIYSQKELSAGNVPDAKNWASGIYFIEVFNAEERIVKKIIKQ